MKKLLLILSGVWFVGLLSASIDEEHFAAAARAYDMQAYEQALSLYEKIEQKTASVWYNMGNCYHRLSDQMRAELCWGHAYPRASAQLKKMIEHNGVHPSTTIPLLWWQLMTVVACMALAFVYMIEMRWYGIVCALCMVIGAGSMCIRSYRVHAYAVLLHGGEMKVGPHPDFHALKVVHAAEQVRLIAVADGWCKVRDESGCTGWIEQQLLLRNRH